MIYYLAALSAAFLWAISSMVSKYAVDLSGAIAFNRIRLTFVSIMLGLTSLLFWDFEQIKTVAVFMLMLSGLIGIFLGDTFLFMTLERLGPRRTQVLFATSAPQTVILSYFFLGSHFTFQQLIGVVLVSFGVIMVIFFSKNKSESKWENTNGRLLIGLILGLLAGLCQAVGIIISKPIMIDGFDPILASFFRVGIAAISLQCVRGHIKTRHKNKPTKRVYLTILLSGFLGMALGMTLVMFALEGGKSGIVATLSSTSPVLVLPLLWMMTKKIPPFWSWIGALLSIIGMATIFITI